MSYPVSDDEQNSEGSEKQMEPRHEDAQFKAYFGLELESEDDDAGSGLLNRWRILLEREWSRREVAIEQASWRHFYNPDFAGE